MKLRELLEITGEQELVEFVAGCKTPAGAMAVSGKDCKLIKSARQKIAADGSLVLSQKTCLAAIDDKLADLGTCEAPAVKSTQNSYSRQTERDGGAQNSRR